MTKVLAVRYPTSADRVKQSFDHLRQVFEVPDVSKIKDMFATLLFDESTLFRYNYCLVRFDNKLYVIEPVDLAKCTYVRKQVEYHPLSNMI
jgi:hypothetical protein